MMKRAIYFSILTWTIETRQRDRERERESIWYKIDIRKQKIDPINIQLIKKNGKRPTEFQNTKNKQNQKTKKNKQENKFMRLSEMFCDLVKKADAVGIQIVIIDLKCNCNYVGLKQSVN